MAIMYDAHYPTEAGSSPQAPLGEACSAPRQAPVANTANTIGFLHDADSNRTFRIPDVPATSSITDIKQWYSKNVASPHDQRHLVVLHNSRPLDDATQVWQLAMGQAQFSVTVAPQQLSPRCIAIVVDTPLHTAPIQLRLSTDSTVLYTKQRLMEILNLPMATATAAQTTLVFPPAVCEMQNSHTLMQCNVPENAHLVLSLPQPEQRITATQFQAQQTCQAVSQPAALPQPTTPPSFARIRDIWSDASSSPSPSPTNNTPNSPQKSLASGLFLPSALLDDEEDAVKTDPAPVRSVQRTSKSRRGRRSHSPPSDRLTNEQLQHMAANFRTKMCRNEKCKFGRNCWFAHNKEELRKPSDALPNNLPAVHKLERYSHRESNDRR